ncbi:hypothetical protein [Leptospira wolffii]|uniref:hypothetical protein n=1 Tax=Leptospira wolffii TaxID=409998 RepID=UPI00058E26F7|nr:hypothetical protein [Leptospira wolffii]
MNFELVNKLIEFKKARLTIKEFESLLFECAIDSKDRLYDLYIELISLNLKDKKAYFEIVNIINKILELVPSDNQRVYDKNIFSVTCIRNKGSYFDSNEIRNFDLIIGNKYIILELNVRRLNDKDIFTDVRIVDDDFRIYLVPVDLFSLVT